MEPDFPQNMQPSGWKLTPIPGGPVNAQPVLDGMRRTNLQFENGSFLDYQGQQVYVPTGKRDKEIIPIGYAQSLWDLVCGNLIQDTAGTTLYRRDIDLTGRNRILKSWHAVEDLATEYNVPSSKANTAWDRQMLVETAKNPLRLIHGVKFTDRLFARTDAYHPVQQLTDLDNFERPTLITVNRPYDDTLAAQAVAFLRDITADAHSAENLARMFATPALQPYQHLIYVMYGQGGNGKGITLAALNRSFPRLARGIDVDRLTGGRKAGGFAQENETSELMGALWAYDTDADTITLDQLGALKKISTGDPVTGRRIGQNEVKFQPHTTIIIATNNPVITTMTAASTRRYAFIRMRDGRKAEDFQPLLEHLRRYDATTMLMASCKLWQLHGDEPWHDVTIGDTDDLSDGEQWMVDHITRSGYAVSGDNPFRMNNFDIHNAFAKLGLRSALRTVNGKQVRVAVVQDEQRFAPYRHASQLDIHLIDMTDMPMPIDGTQGLDPTDFGFRCDYWPALPDKKSIGWQKGTQQMGDDTAHRPKDTQAWAVIPRPGYIILDMDVPTDGPSGWDILNHDLGIYGSMDFPRTLLASTPHGGVHAYYRIPDRLHGKIKDIVHNNGLPVDIRAERRGYVIGPNSRINAGDYKIIDVPDDQGVPELSAKQVQWLADHGGIEGTNPIPPMTVTPRNAAQYPAPDGGQYHGTPSWGDLTHNHSAGVPEDGPWPEGQRNTEGHRWAYGRVKNHPENLQQIHDDLFRRERESGLPDSETEGIWRSIMRRIAQEEAGK